MNRVILFLCTALILFLTVLFFAHRDVDTVSPCHRPLAEQGDNTLGNGVEAFGVNRRYIDLARQIGDQQGEECLPLGQSHVDSLQCSVSEDLNGVFSIDDRSVLRFRPELLESEEVVQGVVLCTGLGDQAFTLTLMGAKGMAY